MDIHHLFLDRLPKLSKNIPVTWGVPWKKGEVKKTDHFALENKMGESNPVQSWVQAYWPDGSVKWTAHSAIINRLDANDMCLEKHTPSNEFNAPLQVKESADKWFIHTNQLSCEIPKSGQNIIESISLNGQKLVKNGSLILEIEEQHSLEGEIWLRQRKGRSKVTNVTVEQNGLIRSVVCLKGTHQLAENEHKLPFKLRFYFYKDQPSIRYVHTFIVDGEPAIQDQIEKIKAIGITFKTIASGKPYNRHIQIATENGWYNEASQLMLSRRYRHNDEYKKQIAGDMIYPKDSTSDIFHQGEKNAIWQHFKLMQDNVNHYKVTKSTGLTNQYIDSIHREKAKGGLYVGSEIGGILTTLKDFWQKYPSSIEVNHLADQHPTVTAWFWPKEVEAMNLEHYSTQTHVESAYEGFDELRATPAGIANTNEGAITLFQKSPSQEDLNFYLELHNRPVQLHCTSSYYADTKACGFISSPLPNTSNPWLTEIEKKLDEAIHFYQREIIQRNWYGLWNYGDVMHTYDSTRHQWCYDLGGFAWQNTELVPNLWFWYSFMRKPTESLFIMAEAMTRHTSEVDQYHTGKYQGFGSRHNVMHWGCGCKEVRISMASLHKYYYFLTGDERVGEVMEQVKDVDQRINQLPPMREFYDVKENLIPIRTGPDWSSFLSNWIHQWEKTNDATYYEKIKQSIQNVKEAPLQLLSGPVFYYEKEKQKLVHMGDGTLGDYHMVIAFGAPQVWFELDVLLEDNVWKKMLADFGSFYLLSDEEMKKRTNGKLHKALFHWPMFATGIAAYAARYYKDSTLAEKVWEILLRDYPLNTKLNEINEWDRIIEVENISTNAVSQWCLNAMTCLALIGDYLPKNFMQESDNAVKK
ncbi:hypothetical protein [Gracilibacillus sp. YIM 98692]|uniref:exo-rhamnogalacturonan lyase family protein n=1 Tax=Gracilibacillus sp. YIM 98692 TaxID=2663532 RepID=UPI0013D2C384|nr:hypothetical protein [Gracilibacillus sp. YIM 98692]